MRRWIMLLGVGWTAGCASAPAQPPRWERRVLTTGIELHVSDEAGPAAQAAADEMVREFRARHLLAR